MGETGILGSFPTANLINGTWKLGPVRLCSQIVHRPHCIHAGSGDSIVEAAVLCSEAPLGAGGSSWLQSRRICVLQVSIFLILLIKRNISY